MTRNLQLAAAAAAGWLLRQVGRSVPTSRARLCGLRVASGAMLRLSVAQSASHSLRSGAA